MYTSAASFSCFAAGCTHQLQVFLVLLQDVHISCKFFLFCCRMYTSAASFSRFAAGFTHQLQAFLVLLQDVHISCKFFLFFQPILVFLFQIY